MPHPAAELFPEISLLAPALQIHSEYGKLQLLKQLGFVVFWKCMCAIMRLSCAKFANRTKSARGAASLVTQLPDASNTLQIPHDCLGVKS